MLDRHQFRDKTHIKDENQRIITDATVKMDNSESHTET